MRKHKLHARAWLVVAGIIVLIVGHVVVLHYSSSQVALPAAVVSGAVVLFVIKHLGLLAPVYALFRRRARRKAPFDDQDTHT
jgi:hypothetical protein